jgi:3,4-dihydroxy 2-butanone 4-phosphate synthase/GTP cyclohydrolase II
MGDVRAPGPVLVRVQTACFPGDVFGSAACDCGAQLAAALQSIERAGRGVLLYVIPSGRHSLLGDFKSHVLHEETARVVGHEHKLRDFGLGAQVLSALGIKELRLLTNNPKKIAGLEGYGMCVVERVPLEMPATRHNLALMRDKRDREGHLFSVDVKDKP